MANRFLRTTSPSRNTVKTANATKTAPKLRLLRSGLLKNPYTISTCTQ